MKQKMIEATPTAAPELVEACCYTSGGYGSCWNCYCAESCPTWLGTGAERAYVRPDGDHYATVAVM